MLTAHNRIRPSHMSSESDPQRAMIQLAPHEIGEWQASENAHTSVRRLSLVKGKDSVRWHADQVFTVTEHLSADREGVLEFLEIAQFAPDARSTEGDPPPIGEVLKPVAHSLTSIRLDVPEVKSGTLLGILYNLPKLQEFTIYAPTIQKTSYEGGVVPGGPPTTGKLELFHLDVGGDDFINQFLQHPLEYHTIGLSHSKLIDSYNALIDASGATLRRLAIQDIGKPHLPSRSQRPTLNSEPRTEERHFKRVHDHISVANCSELSELIFGAGEISEAKTARMITAVLSTVSSTRFEKLRISYQFILDSDAVTAEADSPEWDAVDEELVRIAGESDRQIEVTFNSIPAGGDAPIQATRFLSRFQEKGTIKFTFEPGYP
jgi:hypothetical protein